MKTCGRMKADERARMSPLFDPELLGFKLGFGLKFSADVRELCDLSQSLVGPSLFNTICWRMQSPAMDCA
jgi:hypothetical protein